MVWVGACTHAYFTVIAGWLVTINYWVLVWPRWWWLRLVILRDLRPDERMLRMQALIAITGSATFLRHNNAAAAKKYGWRRCICSQMMVLRQPLVDSNQQEPKLSKSWRNFDKVEHITGAIGPAMDGCAPDFGICKGRLQVCSYTTARAWTT
jgi:hypothetical protein